MTENPPPEPPKAGPILGEFLKELEERQEKRKESLEARANQSISVSGALVTLLFGLAALATKASQTYKLPGETRPWLYFALVCFVLSTLLAIRTVVPREYLTITDRSLDDMTTSSYLTAPEELGLKHLAIDRVAMIKHAKKQNSRKANALVFATALQVAAIGGVAVAVYYVLRDAPTA